MQDEPFTPGTDHQTGLPDDVGWNAVLEAEELRLRRHGGTHGLIRVRLDAAPGAEAARAAAQALAGAIRDIDLLARITEQTFGVLALHCEDLPAVVGRIRRALAAAGLAAAPQVDSRSAGPDLRTAWSALVAGDGPAPASSGRFHHTDFVVRTGVCLN